MNPCRKCGAAVVALWACCAAPAHAQSPVQGYPTKAVRMIVPYAPGGPYDDIARALGQRLAEIWGNPLVVDNRGGAGGNIGADMVAKSAPDGYTLLLGNAGPITVNATLFKKLPYDPQRDLAPITMVNVSRMVLTVHPSLPARNVRELIALARAHPGTLNYGSAGVGNLQHLAMELLQIRTGARMNHVPYKGAAPAFVDLIAGQVDTMFANIVGALPHLRNGRVRALAVSTAQRSPLLPDVPSVAETVKDFDIYTWSGIFAPGGLPRELTQKLNGDFTKVLQRADIKERFAKQGSESTPGTPEALAEYVRKETVVYANVIRTAGITAEQ